MSGPLLSGPSGDDVPRETRSDGERRVVCEECGLIVTVEPVPPGEPNADRLVPADVCDAWQEALGV